MEKLAQRYAARLVVGGAKEAAGEVREAVDYQESDVASLELVQSRSIGVEHAGLAALEELQLPWILADIGLNGVQQAAAIGSIIGRMAGPFSFSGRREEDGEMRNVDAVPLGIIMSAIRLFW